MFNGSNCDKKSQLSGILTGPLNPRAVNVNSYAYWNYLVDQWNEKE